MKTINLEIQVPDWVEWVAQDYGGMWTGFSRKPHPQDISDWWECDEGKEVVIAPVSPLDFMPNPNWKQSLRKV